MTDDKTDVHTRHCCAKHGCKYSDEDCTVVSGEKIQEYTCEICEEDNQDIDSGFRNPIELNQYFKSKKDGLNHYVTFFTGVIVDESGTEHLISDCKMAYWTKKQIDEVRKKADEMYERFTMNEYFEKFYKEHYDDQLALVEDLTYEDQREKMLLFGFFREGYRLGLKNRLSDGEIAELLSSDPDN